MKFLAQVPVDIGAKFGSPFGTTSTVGNLVSLILKIAFTVSGVLILFFILFAGFKMVAGAGGNDPKAAEQGKQAASAAVLGFVIVFVAYWIVKLIGLITGLTLI